MLLILATADIAALAAFVEDDILLLLRATYLNLMVVAVYWRIVFFFVSIVVQACL